jgi:hypothetical protein
MKSKRKFSREFKQTAIRQMAGGKRAAEVARLLEVHPSDLYRWRRELNEYGAGVRRTGPKACGGGPYGRTGTKGRSASAGNRFSKASLAACRGTAPAVGTEQRRAFYQQVEKERRRYRVSVAGMCSRAGFSRAGYYRAQQPMPMPSQEDLKLRDAMHRVALEWPAYGSRRMSRELRKRGMKVNRKRLQRWMREDNLLCVAKRKFVVTTDSAHRCRFIRICR